MDYKKRVLAAMMKNHKRELKKNEPKKQRKKKNQRPEKELVEKPCIAWMKSRGFRYKIIEAKATWSPEQGCWKSQAVKAGTLDCHFTDTFGQSCWVEFKAPGKRSTIHNPNRALQLKCLIDEINANCFAAVVDSVEMLESIYDRWRYIRMDEGRWDLAREFLLENIPPAPKKRGADAGGFDSDLGF